MYKWEKKMKTAFYTCKVSRWQLGLVRKTAFFWFHCRDNVRNDEMSSIAHIDFEKFL